MYDILRFVYVAVCSVYVNHVFVLNVVYASRTVLFFFFFFKLNVTVFYTSSLNHRNNTKMTNYKNNTLSFFLVPSRIDTMVWQRVRWLNHDHLGLEIRCFPKGSRFCSLRRDVCISIRACNIPFPSIIRGCILPIRARAHEFGSCGSTARFIKRTSQV